MCGGEGMAGLSSPWMLEPTPILANDQLRLVRRVCGLDASRGGGYAGGWFVGYQKDRACIMHPGAIDGFASSLAYFPDQDLCVVVLANMETYDLMRVAAEDFAAIALGDEVAPRITRHPIQLDASKLAGYVGSYAINAKIALDVTLEGGQLMIQATGRDKHALFAASETLFFTRYNDRQIYEFGLFDAGEPQIMTASNHGGRSFEAQRRSEP